LQQAPNPENDKCSVMTGGGGHSLYMLITQT
jgi:hypothetical protein